MLELPLLTSNSFNVMTSVLVMQLWPHGYQLAQSVLKIGFALAKKVG